MSSDALGAVWRSKAWVVVAVVVAGLVAFFVSSGRPKVYEASAVLQAVSGRQASGDYVTNDELLHLTNVMVRVARTTVVADRAAAELPGTTRATFSGIQVASEPDVEVIKVTARAGRPSRAAELANAYARAVTGVVADQQDGERKDDANRLQSQINDLQARSDTPARTTSASASSSTTLQPNTEVQALQQKLADRLAQNDDSLRVLEDAAAPASPASPKPARDALLAAVFAALVSMLALYAREMTSDRFTGADDAARSLGLPLLGQIPRSRRLDAAHDEAIRGARTSLDFGLRPYDRPVVLIVGPGSGSGKTHVVANLARAFAAGGAKVVAVDSDVRRPSLHVRLGAPLQPGLGDVLAARRGVVAELQASEAEDASGGNRGGDLDVVAAGIAVPDPAEALASARMDHVVRTLRSSYELVILDSPPILAVADALVLSRYANAVVLVVDRRRDKKRTARRAVEMLQSVDAPLLGVIFNGADEAAKTYGTYGNRASSMLRRSRTYEATGS